jgi:hypothetical protein
LFSDPYHARRDRQARGSLDQREPAASRAVSAETQTDTQDRNMSDQSADTMSSRSRAKVFTCMFCRKFVIESHDRECCTRTLCAKCHEKFDIVDCHLNCYDWDYLFRESLHAQGINQFESIRTNAPREPSATECYQDGIVVPRISLVPTETLIARAAEMVASRSNPFLPPTAIRRLHGWMEASLPENIREYAPPLMGLPYVQLIYDSHSFPVRTQLNYKAWPL